MKLASFRDGSRDGQLMVVARDHGKAHFASEIAPTMQRALDDWDFVAPQLEDLYETLNQGRARHAFPFDARQCVAPLPRACQRADASTYPSHVERVRRARNAPIPDDAAGVPLIHQGGSDDLLGPHDDVVFASEDWGIDFAAEIAAITDDVPNGSTPQACVERIRLLVLVNDWTLRNLVPEEIARGFGFYQSKPACAFGPLAVTPQELGEAWKGGRAHGTVRVARGGARFGELDTGVDMAFDFGAVIAHMVKTRRLRAGTIVGAGTVSNRDAGRGCACIAEKRALETIADGQPSTPFMRFGEQVRIEMTDPFGRSVFGAIEQRVRASADR